MVRRIIIASLLSGLIVGAVGCGGGMSNTASPALSGQTSERAVAGAVSANAKVSNPVPELAQVSPAIASTGAGKTTLTLTGTGFVKASEALWNGRGLTTKYVSATMLSASVPSSDLESAGTYNIAVKSPAPGGGTSAALSFVVDNPAPALSSLKPPTAVAGSAKLTVTATGAGFVKGSEAQWDGVSLPTTDRTATSLTFVVPASDLSSTGTHNVAIVNGAPGGGTSGVLTFSVVNPAPSLSSISPKSVAAGSSDTTVKATGKGYVAASQVLFDGSAVTTTYVSPTSLTFVAPAADLTSAGKHAITVSNPTPGGGASAAVSFTVASASSSSSPSPFEGAYSGTIDETLTVTNTSLKGNTYSGETDVTINISAKGAMTGSTDNGGVITGKIDQYGNFTMKCVTSADGITGTDNESGSLSLSDGYLSGSSTGSGHQTNGLSYSTSCDYSLYSEYGTDARPRSKRSASPRAHSPAGAHVLGVAICSKR